MKSHFFWKVAKIKTLDITVMGLVLGLYLILDITTGWSLGPFYLGINLKYIPLFVLAAYTDWFRTLIVCILANIICFFFPTNWDQAMPIAYIFDYTIPILTPVMVSFFAPRIYEKPTSYIVTWTIIICFQFLIALVSKTIAGVLFYASGNTSNQNVWLWSFSINAVNEVVDLILFLATVPFVCNVLQPLRRKIYKVNDDLVN